MAPIRVGFIGFSASQGAWANKSHFPYLDSSSQYEIVALSNSSQESGKKAIESLGLDPKKVKAYGKPEDLAADPDVDLVIVSVNVALHKQCVWPILEAKKDVFVEWPLGKNLEEGKEMAAFAKKQGVKTAVGLQGRFNPDIVKVKKLVESGRIGKVLSSSIAAMAGYFNGKEVEAMKYFLDKSVGGNMLTIGFGHIVDSFQYALGEFKELSALTANQRPTVGIVDAKGKVVESDVPKDTDDQIMVQGTLSSGAVASIHMRGGPSSIDGRLFRWQIYGTEGEIQVESPVAFLQFSPPMEITVFNAKSGKKEQVEVNHDTEDIKQKDGSYLAQPGANVGRFYSELSKGEERTYADFDDAVDLHNLITKIAGSSSDGKQVVVKDN